MPIRPELSLDVPTFTPPNPLNQLAQVTQIQNALQQQRMGQISMENALREQRREQDYETTLAGFKPGMGLEERVAEIGRAHV